jgi:broad specificity phosphatase PhoE
MMLILAHGSKAVSESRILLVRHAETSDPHRFHGAESDVGLGERGYRQAASLGDRIAERKPQALYSSGMLRACQTAEIIGRACGLAPRIVPDLHERRMGPLSGVSREEGLDTYNEAKMRWSAGELEHTHPGGESFAAIQRRVLPLFRRFAAEHPGSTIVVVAHGVVIRVALTSLLEGFSHKDFGRVAIDNAAINEIACDRLIWTALALNERGHLTPGAEEILW